MPAEHVTEQITLEPYFKKGLLGTFQKEIVGQSTLQPNFKNRLLDKFAFVADHKHSHPLHFQLCNTFGAHIAHEANTKSVFSIEGMFSDSAQDARHLQLLVRIKSNRASYEPD